MKIAKIIFINNYRPISFLPAILKIFEKVIFKQLFQFFQDNKLFYNAQYVFGTEHITEFAALELTDRITIQIYHAKTFDTQDHRILLEKN